MTITDIGIRLGDFSFGILFMSQLIMTAALYKKGKAHRLQRMMFGFMLFLTLISAFEMVFFYFADNIARWVPPVALLWYRCFMRTNISYHSCGTAHI